MKLFCVVVLCACLFSACDKDNDEYEPVKPPIEQPEEPVEPPSTDDIINVKIGNVNMIVGSNDWTAVAYGNGKYVAVGYNGYVTTSSDGTNWAAPKQVGSYNWYAITYGGGKFVAVGALGFAQSAVSSDGVNWTLSNLISRESSFVGVTYFNGTFIAADNDGNIWKSTNGLSGWTSQQISTSTLQNVNYLNGLLIATDASYRIWISSDGNTWSNGKTTFTCYATAYGNGKFVIVGNLGYITTSNDGINWSSRVQIKPVSSNFIWYGVAFANDKFVAVGYNGYIATSIDGVKWETKQIGNSRSFFKGLCVVSN